MSVKYVCLIGVSCTCTLSISYSNVVLRCFTVAANGMEYPVNDDCTTLVACSGSEVTTRTLTSMAKEV